MRSSFEKGLTKSCGCLKKNYNQSKGYEEISYQFYRRIKRNATDRGIEFSLEMKDIWDQYINQNRKCKFTNLDLTFTQDYNYPEIQTVSVERTNSNKGYSVDNIQVVHKFLNVMKQSFTNEEFVAICKTVSANFSMDENIRSKIIGKSILGIENGVSGNVIRKFREKIKN